MTPHPDGAAWIKLDLLANGVTVDSSVLRRCARGDIARRRNVYNTPVWSADGQSLPQEIRVGDCVVAVNLYGRDAWCLSHDPETDAGTLRHGASGAEVSVEYINDLTALARPSVAQVANVYGGAALAFFSPRSCYFFADGTACGFCSLRGTARDTRDDFKTLLSEDDVERAVCHALADDPDRIEQVMIVGGNLRDLNRGFRHHVSLGVAASRAIASFGREQEISVHIATMPPHDQELIALAGELPNAHMMFNLEVWDATRFAEICPGKDADYGRGRMLAALEKLVAALGEYRAHSILVTGLETPGTTLEGARALAEMGVSPIINVYHSDKHSRIGLGDRPTFAELAEIAEGLQRVYADHPVRPYWRTCGRNAIDREAELRRFDSTRPPFL